MSDIKRPTSSSSQKKQDVTTSREGSAKLKQIRPDSCKNNSNGNKTEVLPVSKTTSKSGAAGMYELSDDETANTKSNKSDKICKLDLKNGSTSNSLANKTKDKSPLSKMYELSDDDESMPNTNKGKHKHNNNTKDNSISHNAGGVHQQQMLSDITTGSVRPSSSSQRKEQAARVGSANKQTTDNDRSIASKTLPTVTAVSKPTGDQKKNLTQSKLFTLPDKNRVKMWVQSVGQFSSEYHKIGWHATQIIGPPKVYPHYGDITGTWAQAVIDNKQFIELVFPEKVYVEQVNIYETFNAGAVVKVLGLTPMKQWATLWKTDEPSHIEQRRILSVTVNKKNFATSTIRLNVDCTASDNWCEIDAVELVGLRCLVDMPKRTVLPEAYLELVNNQTYSDVNFTVEGHTIFAHRAVLATRSSHFKGLFENNATGKVISITQISAAAFLAVLEFVYTGSISNTTSPLLLLELIEKSAMFGLQELADFAKFILLLNLNEENVLSICSEICTKYPKFTDIQEKCIDVIAYSFEKLSTTTDYSTISQDIVTLVKQRYKDLILTLE